MKFFDADGNKIKYDGSPLSWRVSAYALIFQDEQVFLVKHNHEKNYDLPGGGIDFGESVEEALTREVMEEAGIGIQIGEVTSYHQDYFYHQREKKFYQTMLLFFKCKIVGDRGKPTDSRIEFADFISLQELENYPLMSFVRRKIQENYNE